jgi:hypothetical protein
VRIIALFSLLVALAVAPAVLPASAQQGTTKAFKDKLDANKRIAEDLLKRSEQIIAHIKASDEKAVEDNFNKALSLVEEAIRGYDAGSPVAKALDDLDGYIEKALGDARKEASTAPALWEAEVVGWGENQKKANRLRTELKKQLIEARAGVAAMQQNKKLLLSKIRREGVDKAQDLIELSLKDFGTLSQSMKDMISTPSKAVPGSGL